MPNPIRAIKSSTYPLQGLAFVARTPQLYGTIIYAALSSLIVTLGVVALVFGYLLRLQATAIATLYHENQNTPFTIDVWIWCVTVILCLFETVAALVGSMVIAVPFFLDSVFDRVLLIKGVTSIRPDREGSPTRNVHRFVAFRNPTVAGRYLLRRGRKALLFSGLEILTLMASLPINILPGIGTAMYISGNGLMLAWDCHLHYLMDYRGLTLAESRDHIWANKDEYTSFGMTAFALGTIPLLNFVFAICNMVGAALWAIDIELARGNPCFVTGDAVPSHAIEHQTSMTSSSQGPSASASTDAIANLESGYGSFLDAPEPSHSKPGSTRKTKR